MNDEKGQEILGRILSLAFCRANDAIKLLFIDPEQAERMIEGLDLEVVSEIKRNPGGAVEIKFIDRLKILEVLRDILGPEKESGGKAGEFYDALDRAAMRLRLEEKDPERADGV